MERNLKLKIEQMAKFHDLDVTNAVAFLQTLERGKLIVVLRQDVEFDVSLYRKKFNIKNIGIPGKMGDVHTCNKKMDVFLKEYKVDYETVLKATDLYLESLNDPRYCIEADNFIFKYEDKVRRSKLMEYCELILDGSDKPSTNYTIL